MKLGGVLPDLADVSKYVKNPDKTAFLEDVFYSARIPKVIPNPLLAEDEEIPEFITPENMVTNSF